MNTQASQFAQELELIGRRVLEQCQAASDMMLHWPLPLQDSCSLFSLALQLVRDIEAWVLAPISGTPALRDCPVDFHHDRTFADLRLYYETWIAQIHNSLDMLPDAFLDLFPGLTFSTENSQQRYQQQVVPLSIHQCLLIALECSAERLGQIIFIRRLFDDGDRLLQQVQQEAVNEQYF